MNIVLLTSHAIAEYDDLRMFTDLGYSVFSIGGAYSETPFEGKRPALPNVVRYPELEAACVKTREAHLDPPGDRIDWAKADLADDIIDWADVIIVHHYPDMHPVPGGLAYPGWITGQWDRIKHKRVIWRTCGQSDPRLEAAMTPYVRDGLEVVRYSPRERPGFQRYGAFAGETALIRFGKYPDDYGPWTGETLEVINVSQGLFTRGEFTHPEFWTAATEGLPASAWGPESETFGGGGTLDYRDMLRVLRQARAYLYTGTQPASYTLGLMEAALSGVPVVSITPEHQWLPELFEGHEIAYASARTPADARAIILDLLNDAYYASVASSAQLSRALDLFDVAKVGAQWVDFLGAP